jgi:hypothetical protein
MNCLNPNLPYSRVSVTRSGEQEKTVRVSLENTGRKTISWPRNTAFQKPVWKNNINDRQQKQSGTTPG